MLLAFTNSERPSLDASIKELTATREPARQAACSGVSPSVLGIAAITATRAPRRRARRNGHVEFSNKNSAPALSLTVSHSEDGDERKARVEEGDRVREEPPSVVRVERGDKEERRRVRAPEDGERYAERAG